MLSLRTRIRVVLADKNVTSWEVVDNRKSGSLVEVLLVSRLRFIHFALAVLINERNQESTWYDTGRALPLRFEVLAVEIVIAVVAIAPVRMVRTWSPSASAYCMRTSEPR